MILPDVNLLVYAYNADAPRHERARRWLEGILNADEPVALPWAVICGFIRLMTHARVMAQPVRPGEACACVRTWLERPSVVVIDPGRRHLGILDDLLGRLGVAGPLTTDAHLAALAIEHGATLHSNDHDFARFEGLRWHDPLAEG